MSRLFCSCCNDLVKAIYPCKFVFHDGLIIDLNICVDCMNHGILAIDLSRKRMVASILKRLSEMNVRKPER